MPGSRTGLTGESTGPMPGTHPLPENCCPAHLTCRPSRAASWWRAGAPGEPPRRLGGDDLDVLRRGAMPALFSGIRAPSMLVTW